MSYQLIDRDAYGRVRLGMRAKLALAAGGLTGGLALLMLLTR